MSFETVFTIEAASIKFGSGATREVGYDMKALGARRVMVVIDPHLTESQTAAVALESLKAEGLDTVVYDQVRVEPTDVSLKEAIAFATAGKFDGYVAIGGGSTIDTAKVADLYSTYPADFLEYVNAPIGKATPVPGPLAPLVAIPTTAGTGSETTGVAIFDLSEMHAKTGISHRALRPRLGIVDPDNTRTLPRMAVACTALDVFCHAIESYTALPFEQREAPASPKVRPAYQGANPISSIWAAKALEIGSKYVVRAMEDPDDVEARTNMILASTIAGVGFGSAGRHAAARHVVSHLRAGPRLQPRGVPQRSPAHPARDVGDPGRARRLPLHGSRQPRTPACEAAALIGADTRGAGPDDAGELLASAVIDVMKKVGMPNGLKAVGFTEDDIPALVEGVLPQHRVTKLSPRPASAEDFRQLFLDSMTIW